MKQVSRVIVLLLVAGLVLVTPFASVFAGEEIVGEQNCSIASFEAQIVAEWEAVHAEVTITKVTSYVFGHNIGSVVIVEIEYETASGEILLATIEESYDGCEGLIDVGYTCESLPSEIYEIQAILAEFYALDIDVSFNSWVIGAYPYFWAEVEQVNITIDYLHIAVSLNGVLTIDNYACTLSQWFPDAVTFYVDGNGTLREAFPVQVYFVNATDHPALHEGLMNDPHGTVDSASYLGELVLETAYDTLYAPDGRLSFVLNTYAPTGYYLAVICGVETAGECEFGAYWNVTDVDGNGLLEGTLQTHASSYLTGVNYLSSNSQ